MRILVVTGSSGGHIFPALALMEKLKDSGQEAVLLVPKKEGGADIPVPGDRVIYMHGGRLGLPFNRRNLTEFFSLFRGGWESLRAVLKFKPDVVVGFGSLDTVVAVFWAWLFRIRTVIHEQNVICGRANKFLSKIADKVAVSFAQTGKYLDIAEDKIILTGNPLRKEMTPPDKKEARDFFRLKEDAFTVLITGGSQGSHRLNDACLKAFSACGNKDAFQVIHICGRHDFSRLRSGYDDAKVECRLFSFCADMRYAYGAADLVVSRAGATTVAELARFKVPALLVPYPYAYAHQNANADILAEAGAAVVIQDWQFKPEMLLYYLSEFLEDRRKLELMRRGYVNLGREDAVGMLARVVLNPG
ncbi:MAG: undecaprenyldiphospho-muramoylpentapeptide beta-N-acetylglucosaminyltransferase [Candidatus Omnitrophica bacterium]|nr:undecaprenyldiphospho-muramoylpentapeptide beta-N-acetylglucosaminyltransferase [Candidatus Omnitrophota bacterium]